MTDFQKQGKANKKKGYRVEKLVADTIKKQIGGFSKPSPRSGGIWVSGDLFNKNNELENWVLEIKAGKQIPLKFYQWYNKLESEAMGKKCALITKRDYENILITMTFNQFLTLINEQKKA